MNIKHNKEEVVKKGLQMFCLDGFSAVGVDVICKTTGMTKGAFYNAFESKENFLLTCLAFYSENNVSRIAAALAPSGAISALNRLENFYMGMLQSQAKNQYMGCMVNNIMSELGISNVLVGKVSSQHYERFLDAIEPAVHEAQQNGEITPNIESRQLTNLLQATFYGVLTRSKSAQDTTQGIRTMQLLFDTIKTNKNE